MFKSITVDARGDIGAVVLGAFRKHPPLDALLERCDSDGAVREAAKRPEFTGDLGSVVEAFPRDADGKTKRVLLVGLGDRADFRPSMLPDVAAAVGRRLAPIKEQRVAVELAETLEKVSVDPAFSGRCFGESLGLLAWNCDTYRGKETKDKNRTALRLRSSSEAFHEGLKQGLQRAESTNLARTLSQTPPNVATPAWMAEQAQKLARETGLSCRVYRGAQLEKEKLQGLLNVGRASAHPPCLIRLEYRPRQVRKGARPVVLVGKTLTFDSGGLSLKINNGMAGMKRDKDGGCAVLGAMHAIATVVRPRMPVVALLAVAENAVGHEAYRPDDVLRFRNGVTVEVTNTDAEGRLVLADALCWACEKERPAFVVDLATLTGGIVVALGSTYAGYFCEDPELRERLENASKISGERLWRLPMHKDYRDMMKSPVADIVNANPNRKAHPIQGAAFLSYFVAPKIPWAHIDIAGVHEADADKGPFVKGPTGWGVRLLTDLLCGL